MKYFSTDLNSPVCKIHIMQTEKTLIQLFNLLLVVTHFTEVVVVFTYVTSKFLTVVIFVTFFL